MYWANRYIGIYTCLALYSDLIKKLTAKYGSITQNDISTSHTGFNIIRETNGAIILTQEGYLRRMLKEVGADKLPTAARPSTLDLFHASSNTTPVCRKHYQKLIGCLIYLLKTRHDIRKEVQFLATKTANPTADDLQKVTHVLAYLNATPNIGPRYSSPEGAILYGHVDASYGAHENGRSQSGYYISIGRFSAPIMSYAGMQRSCVSTGSMEAEYVALAAIGKKITIIRQLLDNIGFTQHKPTTIFEDNKSAINLAIAPQITRNSRHIHVRHHHIRDLVSTKVVSLQHLPTSSMTADVLTKPLPIKQFVLFRNKLLNISQRV